VWRDLLRVLYFGGNEIKVMKKEEAIFSPLSSGRLRA